MWQRWQARTALVTVLTIMLMLAPIVVAAVSDGGQQSVWLVCGRARLGGCSSSAASTSCCGVTSQLTQDTWRSEEEVQVAAAVTTTGASASVRAAGA